MGEGEEEPCPLSVLAPVVKITHKPTNNIIIKVKE